MMDHCQEVSDLHSGVVVIGEQKSGTTMLYTAVRHLVQNASHLSNDQRKELHIFDSWHESSAACKLIVKRYTSRCGWFLDATPAYFSSISTLIQLRATLSAVAKVRLLLILREPAARAHAAWLQNHPNASSPLGSAAENRPFAVAMFEELASLHSRCFREAPLNASATRSAAQLQAAPGAAKLAAREVAAHIVPWEGTLAPIPQWRPTLGSLDLQLVQRIQRTTCRPAPFERRCWLRPVSAIRDCKMYLSRGLQAAKLRAWRSRYQGGNAALLVMRLEDFVADTARGSEATVLRLARFLGVPAPGSHEVASLHTLLAQEQWHRHPNVTVVEGDTVAATAMLRAFYEEDQRQLAA